MNLSAISNHSFIGKLLRSSLQVIPSGTVVPILQGKLRGKRWIIGVGYHGQWLGSYEYEKQRLFSSTVQAGKIVYDIGANVGYYSLLASQLTGSAGKVYSFEPVPKNIEHLKRILSLNKTENVQLIEAAVSRNIGTAKFSRGRNDCEGRLVSTAESEYFEVDTVSIDALVKERQILPPDIVKIDVEGGEIDVLAGARNTFATYQPIIFLATHSVELHQECCRILEFAGYALNPIGRRDLSEADEIIAYPGKSASDY